MEDIYNGVRAPIAEVENKYVWANYKRGYDNKHWMQYLVSVFDILWSNKLYHRAYYLNSLCARFLSEFLPENKQVFVDDIYAKFQDLFLMAEYIVKHNKT